MKIIYFVLNGYNISFKNSSSLIMRIPSLPVWFCLERLRPPYSPNINK